MANNKIFPYKIEYLSGKEGIEYVSCKNAAILHILSLEDHINKELKYPAKFNGFITMVCTRGEVTISALMKDYDLSENTMLIAPASVLSFKNCSNCELYLMAFSNEFAADMNIDLKLVMPIVSSLHSQCIVRKLECKTVVDELRRSFASLYDRYTRREKEENVHNGYFLEMSTRHMFTSVIYGLCEYVVEANSIATGLPAKDRSGDYFKQLISLLHEHYRSERSVEFYADKMNLTPKHLSRVVRNHSGKSVHQWIDEFVVLEIKNLLKYSDMSIQQISYELNFPNPSFMGQYFKRITGKTPGEYRRDL